MQESDLDSFYSHHAASGSAVTLIFSDIMYKDFLFLILFLSYFIYLFITIVTDNKIYKKCRNFNLGSTLYM